MFSKQAFSGCSTNANARRKPSFVSPTTVFVSSFPAVDCNRIAFNNLIKAVQVIHFACVWLSLLFVCFYFVTLRVSRLSILSQPLFFCVINLNIHSHYTKTSNNSMKPVRFDIERIIDLAFLLWLLCEDFQFFRWMFYKSVFSTSFHT